MELEDLTPEQAENISQFYHQQHEKLIQNLALNIAAMSKQPDGALRLQWFIETVGVMVAAAVDTLPDSLEDMPTKGTA